MSRAVLLRTEVGAGPRSLAAYREDHGLEGLGVALAQTPCSVRASVKASGLRGRGGAGFCTGDKWEFCVGTGRSPVYLVANADEGEPGTEKDRALLARDPQLLLEGMAIAAHAVGAHRAFVYLRGEYADLVGVIDTALEQAEAAGSLGGSILDTEHRLTVQLFVGAGAYVCGEETALLESLQGKRGQPRPRPPYPAQVGLWGCPTVVHNVETLCCLPYIMRAGPRAFAQIGPRTSPGPKLFTVSGDVVRPGVYERPMGTPLRELVFGDGGGVRRGRRLKAVIPGGLFAPVLSADELDVAMDFDSLAQHGSSLGTGGIMVFDEGADLVDLARRSARFYAKESCGQCAPCRTGTAMLLRLLETGAPSRQILDLCAALAGLGICPLLDAAAGMLSALLTKFSSDFP